MSRFRVVKLRVSAGPSIFATNPQGFHHPEMLYIPQELYRFSESEVGQEKLAADYDGTVKSIRMGDLAWFNFVATLVK